MSQATVDPIYAQTFNMQPRKGDLRKFAIIQAAVHCLAEDAMENGVFDRIGKRLRIRRTLVAYYFKSKDELLEAAVQYVIATAQQLTIERVQGETAPEAKLRAMWEAAFEWTERYPEQARVLVLFEYSSGSRRNHRKINSAIRKAGADRIIALLRELARERKLNSAEAEIEELGRGLQAELTGFIHETWMTDVKGLREIARRSFERRIAAFLSKA